MTTLTELATTKYPIDKGALHHYYTKFYDLFFKSIQSDVKNVLEIGVENGDSLRMWRDYFPNASIIGIDNVPTSWRDKIELQKMGEERISVKIGDQSDRAFLIGVAEEYGPFDLIIDDGSHYWPHQLISFETLFSFVKPTGYYVVEDTWESYTGDPQNPRKDGCLISYMLKLVDRIN